MTPSLPGRTPIALILWSEAIAALAAGWLQPAPWLLAAACLLGIGASLLRGGTGIAILIGLFGAIGWFAWAAWIPVPTTDPFAVPNAIATLLAGAALAFLRILYFSTVPEAISLPDRSRIQSFILLIPLHFVVGGVLFAGVLLSRNFVWIVATTLASLTLVLVLDLLAGVIARLFTPRRQWNSVACAGAFWFYRWLGKDFRACLPQTKETDDAFRLRLAEMWMWPVLVRGLPALGITILSLTWLSTSIHEVPAGFTGIRNRLGVWNERSLEPGLHLSLPWPLGGIVTVDTGRLREVVLGFQSDPGQPILWERAHYVEEERSLVGRGDDFLSISVPVLYRVGNAADYLRSLVEPDILLRKFAERDLLQTAVTLPASEIMTISREEIRARLHQSLQAQLDSARSGLIIEQVCLRDIHPPVEVAPAFQEVVGAMEEREAFLHEGEAYRRDRLARAAGSATAIITGATSNAGARIERARGEVSRFEKLHLAWLSSPHLFQWRETFRVFDETLAGAKKAIVDDQVRSKLPAHVDLRKVLNPDFVDTVEPRREPLVPNAARSREAFDLDIDGFLRMGQGEIPEVDVEPEDPDNLLKPERNLPPIQQ